MKKNSQIHLYIETKLKRKLLEEAEAKGISFSELCRMRLLEGDRLERIERMLGVMKNYKKNYKRE